MSKFKLLLISLVLGACASTPQRDTETRTLMGYTINEAKIDFALTPDPHEISISACHTQSGVLVPELNQLRMRLQHDYTQRKAKQFIEQYNHRSLYPILGGGQ